MLIEILVFTILIIIQFMIALYAIIVRHKIDKRYDHPLTEMVEAASALENYIKIYRNVDLRLNARINEPAFAQKEFVLINREKMYSSDLFTNFFTLYQLELSKKEHNLARSLYIFQNFLFFFELLFFAMGLALQYDFSFIFIFIAIGLQLFNMFLAFVGFWLYDIILQDVLSISLDLLNLDEIEYIRAESLKQDLKHHVFEYPIEFFKRVFLFFIP